MVKFPPLSGNWKKTCSGYHQLNGSHIYIYSYMYVYIYIYTMATSNSGLCSTASQPQGWGHLKVDADEWWARFIQNYPAFKSNVMNIYENPVLKIGLNDFVSSHMNNTFWKTHVSFLQGKNQCCPTEFSVFASQFVSTRIHLRNHPSILFWHGC